jgi:uncharacterized protein
MNVPVHNDKSSLSFEGPVSIPGAYVSLRAEMDLVVVVSACPQDILKISGEEITDAHFEII